MALAGLDLLRAFTARIHSLPPEAEAAFLAGWQPVRFRRKQPITLAGETERYLYFVTEGVQRGFYEKDGKDYTVAFTYPPSFSGIPESFLTQTPALYHLETLSASKMLRLHHAELDRLMDAHPAVERLMRIGCQQVLAGVTIRQFELMAFSAEEKFRALLARSPHLLKVIPHKYLASYLGMDPTNFSKLMGSVRL